MEKRNILLIEPNYKNKYPPLGLMKLATYHRMLGDNVIFYKGDLKEFIINNIYEKLIFKINNIEQFAWENYKSDIIEYIKTGKTTILENLLDNSSSEFIADWFIYYKDYYKKKEYIKNPEWDRICITTLFTFHWAITIETINFAKYLVKDINELWVGGVMATVVPDRIEEATGIKPYQGLLNKPGIFDKSNNIIIDELPLDYSILDEVEYWYKETDGYHSYMTRGCIRKCEFCAVPTIEPEFTQYVPLLQKIKESAAIYGEKRNLLLLDNNVLASVAFSKIIEEIKEAGFTNESVFIEPNHLEISINNLKRNINDRAYIRKSVRLLEDLLLKLKGSEQQKVYNILEEYKLLKYETATKDKILKVYPLIKNNYEKIRDKTPKKRYVDFNQGLDLRLLTEDKIELLSQIPIRPLRIAFDRIDQKDDYIKAIELSVRYNLKKLSNYLLYNENDKPIHLYQRLLINIELCEKYNVDIYSFPMKYHPIIDPVYFNNRNYIGMYWNRKFLRGVQAILNATKGKIGRGLNFFYAAFGKDEDEYFKILYMPETYIIYRYFFRDIGYTAQWWEDFNNLSQNEHEAARLIIENNDFHNISNLTNNVNIQRLLYHYTITRALVRDENSEIYKLKLKYDNDNKKNIDNNLNEINDKDVA